jgi:UPF0176 protein
MKNRGFGEVYQIEGGIVRYGEAFRDRGLWEGALYVFDKRQVTKFAPTAADIGECDVCNGLTSQVLNCNNLDCRHRVVICESCSESPANLDCDGSHADRLVVGEVG